MQSMKNLAYMTVNKHHQHFSESQKKNHATLAIDVLGYFNGTLGNWGTEPVKFQLKPVMSLYHEKAFPVPQVYYATL